MTTVFESNGVSWDENGNVILNTAQTSVAPASADYLANKAYVDASFAIKVASINQVFFTSSGTYTKPSNLLFAIIEVIGGGAGGGAAEGGIGGAQAAGSGGGAGATARSLLSASAIGATETITIGAPGVGGSVPFGDGTNGSTSSFGSLISAGGGLKGLGCPTSLSPVITLGGRGSIAVFGDVQIYGQDGQPGLALSSGVGLGGQGGNSFINGAGNATNDDTSDGANAFGQGSGGGGAVASLTSRNGGDGAGGQIIITEYLSS